MRLWILLKFYVKSLFIFCSQMRTRVCDNPKPNIFGHFCEGAAIDTGVCGEYECGDISPETYEIIRWELRRHYYPIYAKEGDRIAFENPVNLSSRILHESPTSVIKWSHNGKELDFSIENYLNNVTHIIINSVKRTDFGTYLCLVHSLNNIRTPIKVIVLAVESEKVDKRVIEGTSFVLLCRAQPLPYIYMDLTIKWLLNGTKFSNYDVATIYGRDDLKIQRSLFNYSGIWSCVVEQLDLGFNWTTVVYKVKVKPKPIFLQHLMEDKLTRVIFGRLGSVKVVAIVLVFLIGLCVFLSVFGTLIFLKYSDNRLKRRVNKKHYSTKVTEKDDEKLLVNSNESSD